MDGVAAPRRAELRTLRQTLAKKPKKGSFADLVRQQLQKFPRADCRQMLLANMGALKAQQPQPVLQTLEEDVLRQVSPLSHTTNMLSLAGR